MDAALGLLNGTLFMLIKLTSTDVLAKSCRRHPALPIRPHRFEPIHGHRIQPATSAARPADLMRPRFVAVMRETIQRVLGA
jgi:hypothetical protein